MSYLIQTYFPVVDVENPNILIGGLPLSESIRNAVNVFNSTAVSTASNVFKYQTANGSYPINDRLVFIKARISSLLKSMSVHGGGNVASYMNMIANLFEVVPVYNYSSMLHNTDLLVEASVYDFLKTSQLICLYAFEITQLGVMRKSQLSL